MSSNDSNGDIPEEFLQESFGERIWGLTEMFPDSMHRAAGKITQGLTFSWKFTRKSLWILSTSFSVAILPLIIVQQRMALEDMMNEQKKQGLFGPTPLNQEAIST